MRPSNRLLSMVSLAVAFAVLTPSRADAEPTKEDIAKADTLFRDAQILVQKGQLAEGCSKFAESQRLDPANGTLLNIALCHEKEGKTGTAYRELKELIGLMAGSKSPDDVQRTRVANDRIKALDKKLSRVSLDLTALPVDATIMLDAEKVADPTTPIPIDPGAHVLEITAAAKKAAKKSFDVSGPGTTTVKIEALLDDAPPPPPPPVEPPPPPPPPPSSTFWTGQRVLGAVVMGVGLVGVGVGTVFGINTFSTRNLRDAHCRGTICDRDGIILHTQALNSATTSTIAFGAGALALGVGAVLFITGSSKPKPPADGAVSRLGFSFVPGGASVQTGGTF